MWRQIVLAFVAKDARPYLALFFFSRIQSIVISNCAERAALCEGQECGGPAEGREAGAAG